MKDSVVRFSGIQRAEHATVMTLFTVPLKFIPADYGSWSLRAGVQLLFLNSNLKSVNTGDSFAPIGNIGLTMTY